jgi:hypothetical protein
MENNNHDRSIVELLKVFKENIPFLLFTNNPFDAIDELRVFNEKINFKESLTLKGLFIHHWMRPDREDKELEKLLNKLLEHYYI